MNVQATVLNSLNQGLHCAMAADDRVVLLGEDVLDPYGGAFKVTRGLSTTFPDRIWTTPISEAGIVGIAGGLALRGLRPVVEMMFGDFLTLAADQIINHLTKFPWMYSGNKPPDQQVKLPVVIRAPMGGRRGYGPTHSQTLEKHFLGVPGLIVIAPCSLAIGGHTDPGSLLEHSILAADGPVLFIENKLLYQLPLLNQDSLAEWEIVNQGPNGHEPTWRLHLRGTPPPQLTIAAYGYMAELARQAAYKLAYEYEIFTELVIPTQISPYHIEPLLESTAQTGALLAVEEGGLTLGWGAELLALAAEELPGQIHAAGRVAGLDLPIPASGPLEKAVLPGIDEIIKKSLELAQTR